MSSFLAERLCNNCHAAGLELQDEATAVCRFCGTVNRIDGVICAYCEFINPTGVETCQDCHQSIARKCPNCGTPNWAGAERCIRCQNPLDVVAVMGRRYGTDTAGRLRAQQHDAASIKAKEEVDSQRRMSVLNAMEEHRQNAINDAARVRDNQQRFWIAALIILGFIVIAGTIVFLVYSSAH